MKPNNLVGERFNRLVVTHDAGRDKRKNILWGCLCDCGGAARAYAHDLRAGKVTSCGCRNREGRTKTHGLTHTPIYNVWASMVQRCTNSKDRAWDNYGGRGVTIDPAWSEFTAFYADMGASYRPGLTLDRTDNDAGYAKHNCAWVTQRKQTRNKRSNVHIEIDGARFVQTDAAKELGVTYASLWAWRKKGMTDKQIVERARWLALKKGSLNPGSGNYSRPTTPTSPCR